MLRFKQFINSYLTEAKIDDYKVQEIEIPTDHDHHGVHKTASDIIDHFHSHNPTGDINHTKWMVNQYKQGNIKQEDAPAMGDLLKKFNSNREKLQKKRIEQYKTHGELNTALQGVVPSKTQVKSEKEKQAVEEGSTVVHSNQDHTWHHVHNTKASRVLGKGMPWCTSRMDEHNMFNHYNAMSGGRFYIGHMHNESFPYRKIGVGVGAREFQDENNDKIEGDRLRDFIKRNPDIKNIKALQGTNVHVTKYPKDHFEELMENDMGGLQDHMLQYPEQYNDSYHQKIREYRDQIRKARDGDSSVKNSPYASVVSELAGNAYDSNTLNELSNHPHPKVRSAVAKNGYTSPEDVSKLIRDPVSYVRGSADIMRVPKEHREEIFNNETNPDIIHRHVDSLEQHLSHSDYWGDAPEDAYENYSHTLLNNKNTPDSVLSKLVHHHNSQDILNHPNVGNTTLNSIWADHAKKRFYKKVSDDDHNKMIDIMLNHPKTSDTTLYHITSSNDLNSDQVSKIMNHPNVGTVIFLKLLKDKKTDIDSILNHKNVTDKTLDALSMESDDPEIHRAIANHENVNDETLTRIIRSNRNDPEIHSIVANKGGEMSLHNLSNASNDPEIHKKILNNPSVSTRTVRSLGTLYGVHDSDSHNISAAISKIDDHIRSKKGNPYQLESFLSAYKRVIK